MNNDNMSDIMKNLSSMLDSNTIPENLKDVLNTIVQNSNESNSSQNQKMNSNAATSSEASRTNSNNTSASEIPNLDINTILKMQEIIKGMNSETNSSRSNLLRSLKPYLKPSRQEKVEQYIQLFNMEKVLQLLNNNGKS